MATGIQITPESGITVGTTAITSGTNGRLLFQDGGVVQQSSSLSFDSSIDRLTINTDYAGGGSPAFVIQGSGVNVNPYMFIGSDGNISSALLVAARSGGTGGVTPTGINRSYLYLSNAAGYHNVIGSNDGMAFSAQPHNGYDPSFDQMRLKNGNLGIGTGYSASARLDVKAQGALSTDIAFRVRNSTDTVTNFSVNGLGHVDTRINGTHFTRSLFIGGGNTNNKVDGAGYNDAVVLGYSNTVAGYRNVVIGYNNNQSVGLGDGITIGFNNSTANMETTIGHNNAGRGWKFGQNNTVSVLNGHGERAFAIGNYLTLPNAATIQNTIFFGVRTVGGDPYAAIHENNLGIGGVIPTLTNYDLNARGVFYTRNGTAPTTLPADTFGMYSDDIVAGNAAPHFRTEAGDVIKLYKQSSAGISTVADIVTVLTNLGLLG